MSINATTLLDSINTSGDRLTTFILTFPRFQLAEINTHRMLSRNSASSRAIPIAKMIESVMTNPVIPVWFGRAQSGMQADAELDDIVRSEYRVHQDCSESGYPHLQGREQRYNLYSQTRSYDLTEKEKAMTEWLLARDKAVKSVRKLSELGLHKQIANRILEPWLYTTVIATATDWLNFFALRAAAPAQPEIRELAFKMLDAYNASQPKRLLPGEYHIPFGDRMPDGLSQTDQIKVAVARVARVSYMTFEGDIDIAKDIALHDSLRTNGHMSPFEHIAYATMSSGYSGNFKGWTQYRKTMVNENRGDERVKR